MKITEKVTPYAENKNTIPDLNFAYFKSKMTSLCFIKF